MRARLIAPWILLAALLAAAGLAAAAPPNEAGWSPASYEGDGQDLALASEANILAFATDDPGDSPGDQDLHFLTVEGGPVASQQDTDTLLDPEGTDHVAVSDDGTGLASAVDVGASGPNLLFFNRSDAENGAPTWSEEFARGVTALAITPDGDHLAVATADDNDGVVRLYETRGGDGTLLLEHEADGPVHAVAVDDDAEWILAGGETVANGTSQGKVLLYRETAGGAPVDTYTVEEDLPGVVRAVALTPDARYALAGTAAGRLASFERSGSDLGEPDINAFEGSQVAGVAVRPDGGLVAAGATDGVHLLERQGSGPTLAPRWSHATDGSVVSLAASTNLTHLVAAVPGPEGVIHAYHESRSEPIWTLDRGADHVDLSGDASHVVAARGTNVSAYPTHRALEGGFPAGDGLSEDPSTVPVAVEGQTTHVEVGLRNLGSVADEYDVSASISGDWTVNVTPNQVEILPNETGTADVALQPGSVPAGRYNVSFTAVSRSDGSVRANVTVPVQVEGEADLELTLDGANASRPVEPGDAPQVFLTVENLGNAQTNVDVFARLTPSSSPSWTVSAPDRVGALGPGDTTSFQVGVQVPDDAPDGDARQLDVTVAGGGDRETESVRFVVNPFRKVELDVQPGVRLVNSTVPGFYNATVENQGSIDTSFQFLFERQASGTPGWTVVAKREPFVVNSGDSRTLPIKIVAPQNGAPGDRVVLKVQVVPEDIADQVHPDVQSNVTISAVFRDLPDRDDDRPFEQIADGIRNIPGPGAGAVLALVAAAGGVLGRSRGGNGGSNGGERGEGRTARTSETYKNMQAATGDPSVGPPCCWSTSAR